MQTRQVPYHLFVRTETQGNWIQLELMLQFCVISWSRSSVECLIPVSCMHVDFGEVLETGIRIAWSQCQCQCGRLSWRLSICTLVTFESLYLTFWPNRDNKWTPSLRNKMGKCYLDHSWYFQWKMLEKMQLWNTNWYTLQSNGWRWWWSGGCHCHC